MTTTSPAVPAVLDDDLVLRLAVSAYLGRFTGLSRTHTESDLRLFFAWCADQKLRPLEVLRAQVERYVRWMQEARRFKPSTVSRRMAVVAGFYRTCVIDAVIEHSPADYVRRPPVPAESPTLGLSHLQFEALLTAARDSTNVFDFALVAMLGLLGLRIFEATWISARCRSARCSRPWARTDAAPSARMIAATATSHGTASTRKSTRPPSSSPVDACPLRAHLQAQLPTGPARASARQRSI